MTYPRVVDLSVEPLKPLLRGWLHLVTFPATVIAGLILVALSPAGEARVVTMIFTVCAATLFGISALYHRGTWSPKARAVLKRLDHSSIFLIIAGSYTPYAVLLLPRRPATTLLLIVWIGAILGVLFRVFWVGAPRWLYTPIYLALGWVAVWYLPAFADNGGVVVVSLLIAGGLLYSVGALAYALKRPNPFPRFFGFHEIFHAFTVVAFAAHFAGVAFAVQDVAAQGYLVG